MRVVYSYISAHGLDNIGTDHLFPGILSAFKAVELFGNATLYTTKENIQRLKKYNLPFTDYVELTTPSDDKIPFVYAKFQTFLLQKEPFIHLDLDFILNSKYNVEPETNIPIKFSHEDFPYPFDIGKMEGLYRGYLEPAFVMGSKYGFDKLEGFYVNEIPNMGIISCNDPESFALATQKSLEIYYDNLDYFHTQGKEIAVCYLEQGLIHFFLKSISEPYLQSVYNRSTFIYSRNQYTSPNILFLLKQHDNTIRVTQPLDNTLLHFPNEKDLLNNFKLDSYPSYHLLGLSKASQLTMSVVLHRILNFMDETILYDMEKEFDRHNRNFFDFYKKLIS